MEFSSVAQLCPTLCYPMNCSMLGLLSIANSQRTPKLISIESVVPFNHLILCHPLLLLPSIFPSIRIFSTELVLCIRWPKYWSFNFSTSPSNDYSALISFRINWFHLLAVQGTLKSLLQPHSSKASVLRHSAFFKVQLSHPYMTTGKATALTRLNLYSLVCCIVWIPLISDIIQYLSFLSDLFHLTYSNPKEKQCQRMLKLPHSCTHLTC